MSGMKNRITSKTYESLNIYCVDTIPICSDSPVHADSELLQQIAMDAGELNIVIGNSTMTIGKFRAARNR